MDRLKGEEIPITIRHAIITAKGLFDMDFAAIGRAPGINLSR